MNKCKSEDHLKNIFKSKVKGKKGKKTRILVNHPSIPKIYNKAKTPAEKRLTKEVKTVISGSRKVFDKENYGFGSLAGKEQIDRKKREINYYASSSKLMTSPKRTVEYRNTTNQNMNKLKKLLKWKEGNLKKQQR